MFGTILILTFVTSLVLSQPSSPICVINNSTNPNDPPLPALPLQYQTVIEANIVNKNMSLTAYEYFDYHGDRAALRTTKKGQINMLVFNYKTNELFDIQGIGCRVTDLMQDNNNILFGNITVNGMPHVFTTGGALHFSKSFGEHYKGQTTVRGIQVDHWQSCLHWPQLKSTFLLDYYFTVKSWTDPINFPQIPVRAIAKGQRTNEDGVTVDFLHFYDYFNFRTTITDPTVFETPKGVVCLRKKTKPVPQLPSFYHFRTQVTSTSYGKNIITQDVWYDYTYKLLRADYRMPVARPPLNTTNAVTEIHDFNTGIKYYQDQVTKQCIMQPLSNQTHDASITGNGSYSLFMKDPMQMFRLSNNYTYTGQRVIRGILCDVFSMIRYDFELYKGQPAIMEYYFMADNVTGFPDDSAASVKQVPVHQDINIPRAGYKESIEFWDFDYGHPNLDVFDVMACYSEASKLQFTVTFTGKYKQKNHNEILNQARKKITDVMNVMPIRVQAPKLKYDNSFVYVSAMLLDRSPYEAQFTLISNKALQRQDDYTFPTNTVSSLSDCARACVDYTNFPCNSFDYCQKDSRPCRISKKHVSDGNFRTLLVNSTCDHFSRTVTGPPVPELTVSAAYKNLVSRIYDTGIQLTIREPFVFDPDVYTAVDVSVIFGWLYPQGQPQLNDRFSYHSEITMPFTRSVINAHIWYDYPYQLVRYDAYPLSTIHDFNSGISYTTDMTTGHCTVSQINAGTFDVSIPAFHNINAFTLQLKNPLQFFYLNSNLRYAGQKTIRGIMCDVYEGQELFTFTDSPQPAIFQMYIMTPGWHELSQGSGLPVQSQPIQLVISATDSTSTMIYDFYDFSDAHPDLSNFNIQPCSNGTGQHFLIKFNKTYHPVLDGYLNDFQKQVQMTLSGNTGSTPLRFQNPQITFSPQFTYYIGTMVEQAPSIYDFTRTPNRVGVYSADASYVSITSAQNCADICRNIQSSYTCMSFDYCTSTKLCQLSQRRTPEGKMLNQSMLCDHYSRTVDSSVQPQPTVDETFTIIQDQIAHSLFNITLPTREYQNVTYPAILLDRNIMRYDSESIGSNTLQHFTRLKKTVAPGYNASPIRGISVDDCAAKCLQNIAYECQSFQYCADIGICTLSQSHPADSMTPPSQHQMCDIFARKYTDNYVQYPGQYIKVSASVAIPNINSADLCAYQCSQNVTCKSFDYCVNKVCSLKTKHFLEIPPTLVASSLTCSHYSRNFIADFNKTPQRSLNTGQSVSITNISADNCARLCVENTGFSCQTFTYCTSSTRCIILGDSVKSSRSQIQTSKSCDLYSRQGVAQQHHTPPTTHTTRQPAAVTSKGYTTGAMVGVGAGMLILGILLGALLLYFIISKRQASDQPQYEMSLTNKNYNMENKENLESDS